MPRRLRLHAKNFLLFVTFSLIPLSLSPFLPCILVSRRGFDRPAPRRPAHLPSPERIWCLLTGSSPHSHFPWRYASFGVMTVDTNDLTCGFNWQCTADAIGYMPFAGHSTPGLLTCYSLARFGSTPAGRQPGRVCRRSTTRRKGIAVPKYHDIRALNLFHSFLSVFLHNKCFRCVFLHLSWIFLPLRFPLLSESVFFVYLERTFFPSFFPAQRITFFCMFNIFSTLVFSLRSESQASRFRNRLVFCTNNTLTHNQVHYPTPSQNKKKKEKKKKKKISSVLPVDRCVFLCSGFLQPDLVFGTN